MLGERIFEGRELDLAFAKPVGRKVRIGIQIAQHAAVGFAGLGFAQMIHKAAKCGRFLQKAVVIPLPLSETAPISVNSFHLAW